MFWSRLVVFAFVFIVIIHVYQVINSLSSVCSYAIQKIPLDGCRIKFGKFQRSCVCGKSLPSVVDGQRGGGVHRDPNAIAVQRATQYFSKTCQKLRGGKHVKKRQRQDILCFCAHARKLILGSIGIPLDHLSVK